MTGQCAGGCKSGWTGSFCEKGNLKLNFKTCKYVVKMLLLVLTLMPGVLFATCNQMVIKDKCIICFLDGIRDPV